MSYISVKGVSSLIVALCLSVPVGISIFSVGSKPVYFLLSDILYVYVFFAIFLGLFYIKKFIIYSVECKYILLVLFCGLVLFVLGLIGSIINDSVIPIFSALKLVKVYFFFIFGLLFFNYISAYFFLQVMCSVSVFFAFSLFFSDIVFGHFPYPRLGGEFFGLDVYGFPNSPAVFYSVTFGFCMLGVSNFKGIFLKAISIIACLLIVVVVVGTLSRAAMLNLFCFAFIMVCFREKFYFSGFIFALIFISLLAAYLLNEFPELMTGLLGKFQKFEEGSDPSNGRFWIWAHALNIVGDSPVFGMLFEPFSSFSRYDTPHNQYIEVFFKAGAIGLFAFFTPFFMSAVIIGVALINSKNNKEFRALATIFLALLFSFSLTNIVQPNFSYTPTGVFLAFFGGYLIANSFRTHEKC